MTKEIKGPFPHAAAAKPIWHGCRLFIGPGRTRPCVREGREEPRLQRQRLRAVLKSGPSAVRTPRICELLHVSGLVLRTLRLSCLRSFIQAMAR
jgi:hypothetical protein